MMQLSQTQQDLHQKAVALCQQHRRVEARLIEVLREIDRCKLYKKLGCASLFVYAVELLKLSESVAYAFISVARKTNEISSLGLAIEAQKLSVAKANRMVSALTRENSAHLIEFAIQHSTRELEREVAKINPRASAPDRAKPFSESVMKVELSMSIEVYQRLLRAQNILASKNGKNAGFEQTLDQVLVEYLDRHDPVKKAERAKERKAKVKESPKAETETRNERSAYAGSANTDSACTGSAGAGSTDASKAITTSDNPPKLCTFRVRKPITAEQKHLVSTRDGGRCTHVDTKGKRCESERWLATHHIQHVSLGGSNDPNNLTTLCSYHHDLAHQLSLPLEGQVTWLRDRVVLYAVDSHPRRRVGEAIDN